MGSSFGDLFRISTFGESHGGGVGVIVEGCPWLQLDVAMIQAELDRRRPGQNHITTTPGSGSGGSAERPDGQHLGTDRDGGAQQGSATRGLQGHGGGVPPFPCGCHLPGEVRHPGTQRRGRASARETIGRAAGAIAKRLREAAGTEVLAWVRRIPPSKPTSTSRPCPLQTWKRTSCRPDPSAPKP